MVGTLGRVFRFYYEGFRGMTVGRTLWLLILVKLVIMFLILRLFFFPNFLKSNFASDSERSDYVLQQLTRQSR
ncbi:MAG: DUF4492 domain-containing protein [Bacteroides sp.]